MLEIVMLHLILLFVNIVKSVTTHLVQNWNHCFINVNKSIISLLHLPPKNQVFYPTLSCYITPQSKLEQFITMGVIAGRQLTLTPTFQNYNRFIFYCICILLHLPLILKM